MFSHGMMQSNADVCILKSKFFVCDHQRDLRENRPFKHIRKEQEKKVTVKWITSQGRDPAQRPGIRAGEPGPLRAGLRRRPGGDQRRNLGGLRRAGGHRPGGRGRGQAPAGRIKNHSGRP